MSEVSHAWQLVRTGVREKVRGRFRRDEDVPGDLQLTGEEWDRITSAIASQNKLVFCIRSSATVNEVVAGLEAMIGKR